MKKINYLIVASVILPLFILLTGCPGETTPVDGPTIEFNSSYGARNFAYGETVPNPMIIKASVKAPGGIASISFLKDGASWGTAISSFNTDTTHEVTLNLVPADYQDADGNNVDFKIAIQVTDKQETAKTAQQEVAITFEDAPANTVKTYPAVTMTAQDASHNMVYATADGQAYTPTGVDADKIDFVFIYQASAGYGLYAPSDDYVNTMGNTYGTWDWSGTHNATKISVASASDFDSATYDSLGALNPSGSKADDLSGTAYLSFETVGGLKGVAKLTNFAKADQTISIEVKIQQTGSSSK